MAEIIFGIDHGNGNMKGENVCFPCGLALISINIGKNHLIGSFQRLLMLKQNYS